MKTSRYVCALVLGQVLVGIPAGLCQAQDRGTNCPTVQDQFVAVTPDEPAAFHIEGTNLERSEISVFQYPLGGALEQTGPTPLDFVFIPDDGFTGSTTFVYRVTPPSGCRDRFLLGRVTLAGGTTGRLFYKRDLCGVGLSAPLALAGLIGLAVSRLGPFRRS